MLFRSGANGAVNAVLNADIVTNNLTLGGANVINWINAAFSKANVPAGLANTDGTVFNGNLRVSSTISVPLWYENDSNVTSNATLTSGRNAMMAGPITLDANVTITIPSGSTLAVV